MSSLLEAFSERVVEKLVEALSEKKSNSDPDLIDTNEAARILGISRAYLLSIKDKFGYIKLGETKQSRIFFKSGIGRIICIISRETLVCL